MSVRLDKYLTMSAAYSRKEAKQLIIRGQISVNGEIVKKPEVKIDENLSLIHI